MQEQLNLKNNFFLAAQLLRTAALFGALLQYSFLVSELSDISIYVATIFCAFAAGFVLSEKKVKTHCAVISLLLAPFAARLLIIFISFFTFDNLKLNIVLDSLLLTYDRNNFISIFPFYYTSITTFFSISQTDSSRRALRAFTFCDCAVIIGIFYAAQSIGGQLGVASQQDDAFMFYRLPIVLISVFGILFLLELTARILAIPLNYKLKKNEFLFSVALLLCLIIFGGVFLLYKVKEDSFEKKSGTEKSSEAASGGGLMRPGLFSFDMTPFLNLHTEISMQNELVFIVRKEEHNKFNKDKNILMRRFVLSDKEFKRSETIDEKNQRASVPNGALTINIPPYKKRGSIKQEYYIKNIDGDVLIAMNEPISITPFDNYDYSSFKSVYAVESLVSEALPIDLYNAAKNYVDDNYFGLSKEDFEWYTDYEASDRIKNFAREYTADAENVYAKCIMLLNYFTKGDFRYSLKAGIAPDGDQLAHFLWTTKQGYCSYFALAYATMLRSLGIPCRIAVGFFLDPETEKFGFYPVRSGNAHAWVEIYFPNYGWISFDPTTDKYAEDELQNESGDIGTLPNDNFETLMKEIFENRDKLKAKQKTEEESEIKKTMREAAQKAVQTLRLFFLPIIIILIIIGVVLFRFKYLILSYITKQPRKKTVLLWQHIKFLLRLKGYKKPSDISEGEWINNISKNDAEKSSLITLFYDVEKARYAPKYTILDAENFMQKYKSKLVLVVLALIIMVSQNTSLCQSPAVDSNTLYDQAYNAIYNEYWEQAISLFNQGKKEFADDFRFPFSLANLYFSKQLYKLARDEYKAVLDIIPDYPDALYGMALTEGSLNNYKNAAHYYEKYCELYPGNYNIISELGWVYFKLHRLNEGETLLLNAISELSANTMYEQNPQLAMTLGTIYSDMMNYNESARWYTEAINLASNFDTGSFGSSNRFAATSFYNFAILESRFYNYEKSFEYAKKSIENNDRETGHMMQGELYLRRLDWNHSFNEYEKAFSMDNRSPLPKISLAQNFLITGRLDEALAYAKDCFKARNGAWMFRFGIDAVQYERDVDEILYKTYRGLYNKEKFIVNNSLTDWLNSKYNSIRYKFMYHIYKFLFEKNTLITAQSYNLNELGGQYLEALTQFYVAFERYPRRASFYLNLAADYETVLISRSKSAYLYEQGRIEKNIALLEEALSNFDSVWERDISAETLTEIARIQNRKAGSDAAVRLFILNPGALLQNGIKLPVVFNIDVGSASSGRKLLRQLKKAGFKQDKDSDLILNIKLNGNNINFDVIYNTTSKTIFSGSIPNSANSANIISNLVFEVRGY